jgi:hypothetical protein
MGYISSKKQGENLFESEDIKVNDLKSFYEHMNSLMSANSNRYDSDEELETEEAVEAVHFAEQNGEHEEDGEIQMAEGAEEAEQPAAAPANDAGNPFAFGNPFEAHQRRSYGG